MNLLFHLLVKTQDFSWNRKFESLHIFKEIFGHTNVPQRYENNPCLGAWVSKQRLYFFKSKLSRNRQELLGKIGFDWAPGKSFSFDAAWDKRYRELKSFKGVYGHCNVPCFYSQNKELGNWVKNQRQFYRKKTLEARRIALLHQLGFEFTRRDFSEKKPWKERFRELLNYLEQFGNVMVPQRSGPLGKWVQKQRDLFRKKQIKPYRKDLLDAIFFVWDPRKVYLNKDSKKIMFDYHETYEEFETLIRTEYFSPPGNYE
mmetsp:Transcript_1101/g.2411  ORF Transcript_1101/g.2411 Transcript_1101/m.2411 type:complete len:258 (-) Transcript_1101:1689-2462(-)